MNADLSNSFENSIQFTERLINDKSFSRHGESRAKMFGIFKKTFFIIKKCNKLGLSFGAYDPSPNKTRKKMFKCITIIVYFVSKITKKCQ